MSATLTTAKHGHEHPVFGCDECIAVGNRYSAEGELPAGWAYYEVEVTRTMTSRYYVKAASRDNAERDAEELELDADFYVEDGASDTFVSPYPATPESGEPIWTGGPNGTWETMGDG